MVKIDNDELKDTYIYLQTIENILNKEIRQVSGNKSYLDKLVPSELVKVYSIKESKALSFIDNMYKVFYESAVITLVATFERILFAKYRTTYGTIKNVVKNNSPSPMDYYKSREKFINDKIDKLSGILNLIDGQIDQNLHYKLTAIKDHRNYIAHGKRDVPPPTKEFKIDEIVKILDDAIFQIEK